MQPENKYNDDLEYLSEQGFEKITVNDSDYKDLEKRIRGKSFSFKRFYIGAVSLVIGLIIGAFLFLDFDKKDQSSGVSNNISKENSLNEVATGLDENTISLDTISVVNDNFLNPTPAAKTLKIPSEEKLSTPVPSAEVLISKPIDLSLLNNGELEEKQLKYMSNSPLFYLHDLKITNYTTLYFKKERFVKFTGVSAAYSNANEIGSAGSSLRQNADYFLHEEIAQAMLYFKKEKYDLAIQTLKTVSNYNKEDLNCDFYLGMCYYYKKNYSSAVNLFDRCIQSLNNTFLQEAMYYKAVSLYEKGNKERAKILFNDIVVVNEFYAEKAKEYLLR